jgi:CheY-like chemotaxis protein
MSATKTATKVLLVDDNPHILELLREGIEPLAQISAFRNPEEALTHSRTDPPDLVICDFRMPGIDGIQLVRKLKAQAGADGIRFMLMAAKADVDDTLRPHSDIVEEFVIKPFFVRELAKQTKNILDRIYLEKLQRQAPAEGVMRGRLSEMNIIDLLQSLELGQKNCSLTFTQDRESCRMYFADGQIHHAESGTITGDAAVYRVAGWSEGVFEIDFNGRSDKKTTTQSTQGLLMEALRLLDEAKREDGV